jgi:MscS family membrane protein
MKNLQEILRYKFIHNSIENWLWFFGILLFGWLLKKAFSILVSKVFYKIIQPETDGVPINEFVNLLKRPVEFILSLIFIYFAIDELHFPNKWRIIPLGKIRASEFIDKALDILFIVAITWIIIRLVKFFAIVFQKKAIENDNKTDENLVPFFRDILVAGLVFISFFFILGFVFKQDVISLITGLGIGGVALALAARATLENLFASFTLISEQPFSVGDDIQVGDLVGNVEKVGFRSTRLRHVDGSLIVIPNQMMVSQSLNNLSQREERRHKFYLRIKFETPMESLKKAIDDIQKLLENHPKINQKSEGNARFDGLGDYSINVLVVLYANTSDYWESKTIREEINYEISKILEKHQVVLAEPSTALFSMNDESKIDADY